jgi:hypothetical protein
MRKLTRIATPLMAAAIMSSVSFLALAQNSQMGNQNQNNAAVQDWNTPPAGTEQAQQGFKDGIEAAKLDKLANRPVSYKASHLYVHPPVKGNEAKDAYRSAFQSGYQAAVAHTAGS